MDPTLPNVEHIHTSVRALDFMTRARKENTPFFLCVAKAHHGHHMPRAREATHARTPNHSDDFLQCLAKRPPRPRRNKA